MVTRTGARALKTHFGIVPDDARIKDLEPNRISGKHGHKRP